MPREQPFQPSLLIEHSPSPSRTDRSRAHRAGSVALGSRESSYPQLGPELAKGGSGMPYWRDEREEPAAPAAHSGQCLAVRRTVWLIRAVAVSTGALPILAFPRADLGWLAWTALVPGMLLMARAGTRREAAARGWSFGAGYLLAALYWTLPYIGPGLPLVALVFGALWAPWGMAARALIPRHPIYALLILPSAWVTIELARSRPSLGGPWAVYGATQWHHPTELSLAALGGIWLISFALVAANTALTLALATLDLGPSAAAELSYRRSSAANASPSSEHASPAVSEVRPESAAAEGIAENERPTTPSRASPTSAVPAHPVASSRSGHAIELTRETNATEETDSTRRRTGGFQERSRDAQEANGQPRQPMNGGRGTNSRGRSDGPDGRGRGFQVSMAVLATAIATIGPITYALRAEPPTARTMRINLVQAGIVDGPDARLATGFRLTTGAAPADLTVWGESSVGVDLDRNPELVARLRQLAAARGPLLVNVDAADARGRITKTGVLVGPQGIRGRYTKTRLVPFGEYIPFRRAFGWLSGISKAAGQDRVPGTGPTVMTADGTTFGPLICFESAFPDFGRALVRRGAEVIVYQSATSSFQNSWAPPQHASLAAVRAAETGRPTVQAALTGVSAAFDARGRRIAWLDTDRRGTVPVRMAVPPPASRTPYDRVGDVIPLACLIISFLGIMGAVWRHRREVRVTGETKRQ
ncbi:apolipoprotein N-acyltransferase [Actinomadura gamaensis]|uniref:Apolipoprotein N-acyltransferase n=1 Tax=Actinomadura gamaensis TaxID=1763541 RepID=A0ABV9U7X8_9ACTN